jgi:hypothetical protein
MENSLNMIILVLKKRKRLYRLDEAKISIFSLLMEIRSKSVRGPLSKLNGIQKRGNLHKSLNLSELALTVCHLPCCGLTCKKINIRSPKRIQKKNLKIQKKIKGEWVG